ncbi:MAG: class I SAM-dependent methyltransferase [Myxococcales bacterium]|nr:class I SAM-dependent methyltransferase [Myxococcales bacterium]
MSDNPRNSPAVEGGFRTHAEKLVGSRLESVFERCPDPWEKKLENFPKYVKRQNLTRLLAQYEIFRRVLGVKGSVVECGVLRGGGLMSWAQFSAILEPVNLTRRIYGFDTFEGFPSVSERDRGPSSEHVKVGDLYANSHDELKELIQIYDSYRFLGHVDKVHLVRGDATQTIPEFVASHQHLMVSLLFLDFDLYEPTRVALKHFFPRIPKGGIVAFDELDNPLWPGETSALLDELGIGSLKIQRMEFDPYIGFAVVE